MKSPAWLPRARDVAVISLGLLEAGGDLYDHLDKNQLILAGYQTSLALIGAVSLWWRRTHPERITVLAMVLCLIAQVEVPITMMVFALAVHRRDRIMWTMTAVSGAVIVAEDTVKRGEISLGDSVMSSLAIAVVALSGAYIGARHDRLVALQDRAERAEAEQEARAESARLAERTRIAREMHDVLAHRISLIALHAGGLEITERPRPEMARQTAGLIRETARSALEDLRDVLGVLASGDTSAPLAPQPRFADLAGLVERSATAGVPVVLVPNSSLGLDADVPEAVGRAAYRVVQEALTNIHKHAPTAAATVRLAGAPGAGLEVRVENLAPRALVTPLPGSGSGLAGLRERVQVAGGHFEAGATARGGFLVLAWLPWPEAAARPELDEPDDQHEPGEHDISCLSEEKDVPAGGDRRDRRGEPDRSGESPLVMADAGPGDDDRTGPGIRGVPETPEPRRPPETAATAATAAATAGPANAAA
ncbi:histidine kinase [Catenulispora yoronensis]|uniref:histidine kinase n=1 Tax=Catenulispora yoronensis TaxID=450799 RepID=A0ABP5GST7_9ACTN